MSQPDPQAKVEMDAFDSLSCPVREFLRSEDGMQIRATDMKLLRSIMGEEQALDYVKKKVTQWKEEEQR